MEAVLMKVIFSSREHKYDILSTFKDTKWKR